MKYKLKGDYNLIVARLDGFKNELKMHFDNNKTLETRKFEVIVDNIIDKVEVYSRTVIELTDSLSFETDFIEASLRYYPIERYTYFRARNGLEVMEMNNSLLREKIKRIELLKKYLLIANEINLNGLTDINSVQEKLDFILDALHSVYDSDDFYSATYILALGCVKYRSGEPKDLAEDLKKKKYVIERDYDSEYIKLTVKGASYVERRRNTKKKEGSRKWQVDVNEKLDSILDHLRQQDLGQEIIYDDLHEELQELKTLSKSLKKKTWYELLKGKLFDMAASEVINKEVAAEIFDSLSDGFSKWID